jgi:hypothetical protein
MADLALRIPLSVEEMTTGWFDAAMEEKIAGSRVIEVIHGTATKIKFELDFVQPDGSVDPQIVWIKTGLEPHSKSIGSERVYAGETFFYRNFGGKYETRTPHCYFADSDDDGNSLIVLEDLNKIGAQFYEPTHAASPDVIAAALTSIARYQAASWMVPELWAHQWLREGGSFDNADCLAWIYDPAHWEEYKNRPRFKLLDPSLRNREMLLKAHSRLRSDWLRRGPWALGHGDAHFGQIYSLPSGEVRLLDWQCVQVSNFMQDPANVIASGLSPQDRRSCDRDLVTHYVGKLREFGVEDAPSAEAAFDLMRAYVMHQVSWVMCMVEMQPEENCMAITERASAAAMDYGTIGILLDPSS